jgi:hypothetical protein
VAAQKPTRRRPSPLAPQPAGGEAPKAEPRKAKPKATLLKAVSRGSQVLPAGAPVPTDLTDAEKARLKRIGCIE